MDIARELLPKGYELIIKERGAPDFLPTLADAEYFLGFAREGFGREFYTAAPKLRLIQLISAGYDRIDLDAARKAGVPVANNGGSNSVAVSEATVMLILAVLKRLAWQHENVTKGKWRVGDFNETRLYELAGKTVGIVGLGNIGKKVARRLRGFDVNLQYFDIIRLPEHEEDALGVRYVLFDELLRTSDVVTLHVPLTPLTKNLIGARELALMKPTAFLVNTCRGPVVDENALHEALTKKTIAGAGLDVMLEEPPAANHPLFGLDNITITPHTAGPTWENWRKAFRNGFDNIERVAAGRAPLWVVPELRDMVEQT
ncbi:MAG: lactate dehydrogenase [Candidatus Rokubacteria bacterium]|nr:lactate dehydrogenase [Candidatus Rokubacteria bacterium]